MFYSQGRGHVTEHSLSIESRRVLSAAETSRLTSVTKKIYLVML